VKLLCLFSMAGALFAQRAPALPAEATPKEVRELVRVAAEALQNKDVQDFLDHCDGKMAGYEMLHYYLEGLAARDSVISTIEIVSDKADSESDGQRHMLVLDWTLNVDSEPLRRGVVKVTIEKQGRKWKFTALDPVDFFKPPAR
jgi:hypothetical protein